METPRGDDILREKLSNLSLSRDDTHCQEAPEVICDENTDSQKPKNILKICTPQYYSGTETLQKWPF